MLRKYPGVPLLSCDVTPVVEVVGHNTYQVVIRQADANKTSATHLKNYYKRIRLRYDTF